MKKQGQYLKSQLKFAIQAASVFGWHSVLRTFLMTSGRQFTVKFLGQNIAIRARTSDLAIIMAIHQTEKLFDVPPGSLIVDAGAHIGAQVISYSKIHPGCEILAIEPQDENYDLLCANVAGIEGVTIIKAALVGDASNRSVELFDRGNGYQGFSISDSARGLSGSRNGQVVEAISLKKLIAEYGPIFFLKLDVEGAELELFEKAPKLLRAIPYLAIELHARIVGPKVNDAFASVFRGRRIEMDGYDKHVVFPERTKQD